jgi:cytochrome c553
MEQEETFIKTPGQMMKLAAAAFFIPILIITLLITFVTNGQKPEKPTAEQTALLIQPVGKVYMEGDTVPGEPAESAAMMPVIVKVANPAEQKYSQVCSGCHGAQGGGGVGPKLQGQASNNQVKKLTAYKNKEQRGAQSALMWAQAGGLSADEIKGLADYITTLK